MHLGPVPTGTGTSGTHMSTCAHTRLCVYGYVRVCFFIAKHWLLPFGGLAEQVQHPEAAGNSQAGKEVVPQRPNLFFLRGNLASASLKAVQVTEAGVPRLSRKFSFI